MGRTNYNLTRAPFIIDLDNVDKNMGRQVDWALVPDTYQNGVGKKVLPAGTIVSQNAAGNIFPRAEANIGTEPTHTAAGILESTIVEDNRYDGHGGYAVIVGGVFYQNLLADVADAEFATMLTELEAIGTGWHFETYSDTI